jgi:hypothetical protein
MGVYPYVHHINDVMVSVLASIVGLSPVWVKLKTIKLVFAAYLLSKQHYGVRAKTHLV